MTTPAAQVNQRLYFCRLHLDWFETQLAQEKLPATLIEQSLGESLVYHLVMAYRAYLSEIAETCSLPASFIHSAAQLKQQLEQNGHASAPANELAALESSTSWLAALLARFEQAGITATPPQPESKPRFADITLIADEGTTTTAATGRQWFDALHKLIENQRLQLQEW